MGKTRGLVTVNFGRHLADLRFKETHMHATQLKSAAAKGIAVATILASALALGACGKKVDDTSKYSAPMNSPATGTDSGMQAPAKGASAPGG